VVVVSRQQAREGQQKHERVQAIATGSVPRYWGLVTRGILPAAEEEIEIPAKAIVFGVEARREEFAIDEEVTAAQCPWIGPAVNEEGRAEVP
jgi:hypothetical protein